MLAVLLFGAVCVVDGFSGESPATPISVELAAGNPVAIGVFLLLGSLLVYFAQTCWRIRWKVLFFLAIALILMLPAIAFTDPSTRLHEILFAGFVVVGIVWLFGYAESDCQRSISILAILLVLAAFSITFILGVVDAAGYRNAYEQWPVGLFQRGFLIALSALALRRPNQLAEQVGAQNP